MLRGSVPVRPTETSRDIARIGTEPEAKAVRGGEGRKLGSSSQPSQAKPKSTSATKTRQAGVNALHTQLLRIAASSNTTQARRAQQVNRRKEAVPRVSFNSSPIAEDRW
ncbi:unnamed protein product [Jaminaea pallidilutea]